MAELAPEGNSDFQRLPRTRPKDKLTFAAKHGNPICHSHLAFHHLKSSLEAAAEPETARPLHLAIRKAIPSVVVENLGSWLQMQPFIPGGAAPNGGGYSSPAPEPFLLQSQRRPSKTSPPSLLGPPSP